MLVLYLKELLRPKKLLSVYRHFILNRKFRNKGVDIGLYSSFSNVKIENTVFVGDNCQLINGYLGQHSYINKNTHIKNFKIGRFCSIGSNVTINIGKHPTNFVSTHPAFYSNNKSFKTFADKVYTIEYDMVEIGNDVWIGSNVTILGNVKIGDGAIIAFGSILTKDVPPYAIVAGIPAKVIKYRFETEIQQKLLRIKWWELNDDFFKRYFYLFHDPCLFIQFYYENNEYVEGFRISTQIN